MVFSIKRSFVALDGGNHELGGVMVDNCIGCLDEFEYKTYFPCSQCSRNPNGFLDYYEPAEEPDDYEEEDENDLL
jgi:hypothetical protein